jgi:glucose-6-phosphate 1-dehydrogenase
MDFKQTPANIVIFGGFGDLSWRKLIPAFYNLYIGGFMPDEFVIFAMDYKGLSDEAYDKHMLEGINSFSRNGKAKDADWNKFKDKLDYFQGDFSVPDTFPRLKAALEKNDKNWSVRGTRLFYYAVSPSFIKTITEGLAKNKMAGMVKKDRIVVEKPFGTDLTSAQALNRLLTKNFKEEQIYRIDHYLGKEVVQNILAFRFANNIFEPLWSNKYIDHVQITVAEEVGVGTRGKYYDNSGALRDMIQNHLLQILSVIGMERPCDYAAECIRDEKAKVLKSVSKISAPEVIRAQYAEGAVAGAPQIGYTDEVNVAKNSKTETFAAMKLFIDNKRWKGVPFLLRTGKCMSQKSSLIMIQFKMTPHKIFKDDEVANRLYISIQPNQTINLIVDGKIPGIHMRLKPVNMDFTYNDAFCEPSPEAYETLLLDVLEGDATLFIRSDQVEAAWKIVMPILDFWKTTSKGQKKYAAGTDGPKEADKLAKSIGVQWALTSPNEEVLKCD